MRREDADSKKRIIIILLIFTVFLIWVLFNLIKWQIIRGDEMQKAAIAQQTRESSVTYTGNAIRDCNIFKVITAFKCVLPDVRNTTGNGDVCECITLIKSFVADCSYRISVNCRRD